MATAAIQFDSVTGSVETLAVGTLCTLSNADDTGVTTWLWEMLDRPNGSAAVLSSTSVPSPTFTPDKYGTYRIQLTVNANEDTDIQGGTALTITLPIPLPAYKEKGEFSARGWTERANRSFRNTNYAVGRRQVEVCRNETGGALAAGKSVYINGLDANTTHPTIALADDTVHDEDVVGILMGTPDDMGASVADDALGLVCFGGLIDTTVTGYTSGTTNVGLDSTPGNVTEDGVHRFGKALSASRVLVTPSLESGIHYAKTPAEVQAYFSDTNINHVIVLPGTYNFASGDIEVTGYKYIEIWGNVIFQNVASFSTSTEANTEYYADYDTSFVTWNGSIFTRGGAGGVWNAGWTAWEVFVRDTWYNITTIDGTTIDPTESVYVDGLDANQEYILCKPTRGLIIKGRINFTSLAYPGIFLYGLADSDLSGFHINIMDHTPNDYHVDIQYCGRAKLPSIGYSNSDLDLTSAALGIIYMGNVRQSFAHGWHIANIASDENNTNELRAADMFYCADVRLDHMFLSGVYRSTGTADATGFFLDYCTACNIEGQAVEINSDNGIGHASRDTNGAGNNINLLTR